MSSFLLEKVVYMKQHVRLFHINFVLSKKYEHLQNFTSTFFLRFFMKHTTIWVFTFIAFFSALVNTWHKAEKEEIVSKFHLNFHIQSILEHSFPSSFFFRQNTFISMMKTYFFHVTYDDIDRRRTSLRYNVW